jgi:glycosyltransferase involved in cell wall biosynthesis
MKNYNEKIIVFSRFFLPGFKAGGPIKSLKSLIDRNEFKKNKIFIITSDRDQKSKAYKNIKLNQILIKKKFEIIYLSKYIQNIFSFYKLIKQFNPSIIILNSFFDFNFSIKINLLNNLFFKKKVIIFSRGELLKDAINIKKIKKNVFIFLAQKFNFYNKVKFFTSSMHEKKNIKFLFKINKVKFFPIPLNKIKSINLHKLNYNRKNFKILFVSRILKNKNLLFCLKILKNIKFNYVFNVAGPIEDSKYWNKCLVYAKENKINLKYLGSLTNEKIPQLMKNSNCFLFPSEFESFGHVIYEALCNGLPVVISTNTPWTNHNKSKIIFSANLNNPKLFIKHLEYLYNCNNKKYKNIRSECYQLSKDLHRENVKIKLF